MEQIAAIDKANAKAEAYNNRDITHRLGFWGQVGFSNLFTSGIAFDDKAQTGFQNKDIHVCVCLLFYIPKTYIKSL